MLLAAEMEKRVTANGEKKAGGSKPSSAERGADERGTDRQEPAERTVAEPLVIHMPVDVRSLSLSVMATLATILVLQYAQSVLIPVVLGVLLSYALSPMVTFLARHRVPRAAGAALSVVLLVGSLGVGVYTLSDEASAIVANVPEAARRIRERVTAQQRNSDPTLIKQVQQAAKEIEKTADIATAPADEPRSPRTARDQVQRVEVIEPAFRASDYLWIGGVGLFGFLGQFAVILFLVYFLLVTGDLYKRKLVKIAGPTLSEKRVTVQILDDINQQIESFIKVQLITSVIVAVATSLVLWGFGVENFAMWGLLAGLFNSIPYMGPIVVTGGLGIVAFMQFDDLARSLYVSAAAFAITSLEGMLLTPMLMGRAAQMNPVAIFVGLLFWSWVWGIWGTVLAVPMLMMVKSICDHVEDLQPIGELLGE